MKTRKIREILEIELNLKDHLLESTILKGLLDMKCEYSINITKGLLHHY